MTNQEWQRRCVQKILSTVNKKGRVSLRDLMRATHYERGPRDDDTVSLCLELWHGALEHLERRGDLICEKDQYGNALHVMSLKVALSSARQV